MSEDELKAIEARANKATGGKWWAFYGGEPNLIGINGKLGITVETDNFEQGHNNDTRFIVHAREDIPALLAENRALREALEHYKHCRHACIDCFCTKEARAALK